MTNPSCAASFQASNNKLRVAEKAPEVKMVDFQENLENANRGKT